jgi:hypothetical protein
MGSWDPISARKASRRWNWPFISIKCWSLEYVKLSPSI